MLSRRGMVAVLKNLTMIMGGNGRQRPHLPAFARDWTCLRCHGSCRKDGGCAVASGSTQWLAILPTCGFYVAKYVVGKYEVHRCPG